MLRRGLELRAVAPTRRQAWRTAILAVLMPVKEQIPALRACPVAVAITGLGPVIVRDHSEMLVIHEVLIGDVYELDALPADPALIVDLGANVGVTLLEFHRRYPAARVVGYEAVANTYRLARRNIAGVPNIEVRHAAVTTREGECVVRTVRGASWAASIDFSGTEAPSDTGETVPGVTLDAIIAELGDIDILKLDIEGAEYAVLKACTSLSRIKLIVGEYHRDSGVAPETFFELLAQFEVTADDLDGPHGRFSAVRRIREADRASSGQRGGELL